MSGVNPSARPQQEEGGKTDERDSSEVRQHEGDFFCSIKEASRDHGLILGLKSHANP